MIHSDRKTDREKPDRGSQSSVSAIQWRYTTPSLGVHVQLSSGFVSSDTTAAAVSTSSPGSSEGTAVAVSGAVSAVLPAASSDLDSDSSVEVVPSGSANGDSLIGLEAVLLGETKREWLFALLDVACGILCKATQSNECDGIMLTTYFSGFGIAVPTVLWGAFPALERA